MTWIRGASARAVELGWIADQAATGLYVSAGTDAMALTFLHPQFLKEQTGRDIAGPDFFVYVDRVGPEGHDPIGYRDDETTIVTEEVEPWGDGGKVRHESSRFGSRSLAVLRVKASNRRLADRAVAEGWEPDLFIGMNDGCGAFGRNGTCENQMTRAEDSIPVKIGAAWWVTDHLPGSTAAAGSDPKNGEVVSSKGGEFPVDLRQAGFLSTKWRSLTRHRLYGGARIFELVTPPVSNNG